MSKRLVQAPMKRENEINKLCSKREEKTRENLVEILRDDIKYNDLLEDMAMDRDGWKYRSHKANPI